MTIANAPGAHNDDAAISLLYEVTAIVREETGLSEALASHFAEAITRGLRKRFGGLDMYIPANGSRAERAERDSLFRAEFNGRNLDELCRKYGLSNRQGHRIIGGK
jgi:Mor family transcriptional regulator